MQNVAEMTPKRRQYCRTSIRNNIECRSVLLNARNEWFKCHRHCDLHPWSLDTSILWLASQLKTSRDGNPDRNSLCRFSAFFTSPNKFSMKVVATNKSFSLGDRVSKKDSTIPPSRVFNSLCTKSVSSSPRPQTRPTHQSETLPVILTVESLQSNAGHQGEGSDIDEKSEDVEIRYEDKT